jgi:hypothetical protein
MTSDSEVVTVDLWRKDGQREEIMMIIYELLGRHPRIVTYHGHDPVTFELRVLLQHLPNGDLNGYLQQHPEVPFQNRPKGSLTFIPKMLYGMTSTLATCSSPMTCMLSSATSAPFMSNQIVGFSLKSAHLYHMPQGYYCITRTNKRRQDIFGFGVMLFVILSDLSKGYPHCTSTPGFTPPINEFVESFNLHHKHNFDALPDINKMQLIISLRWRLIRWTNCWRKP